MQARLYRLELMKPLPHFPSRGFQHNLMPFNDACFCYVQCYSYHLPIRGRPPVAAHEGSPESA